MDLKKLAKIVDEKILTIVRKGTVLPRLDIRTLFNQRAYSQQDIEEASDLIFRMLKWVPEERISAREAKMHAFFNEFHDDD